MEQNIISTVIKIIGDIALKDKISGEEKDLKSIIYGLNQYELSKS